MKKLLFYLPFVCLAWGQGQAVNQVSAPPPAPWVSFYYYDGSSNLQYVCQAASHQATTTFRVPATLTNIVVSSNTGTITFASTSYLWPGAWITISGSATSALNGTYKILTVSSATATITTSGVSDATYTDMSIATNSPLLNASVWALHVYTYTGTTLLSDYWAGLPSLTVPNQIACSNRANY